MTRLLGIDYGEKRIGIAVSDPFKITANPLATVQNNDLNESIKCITSIISENNISAIIVGLPLDTESSIGIQAEITLAFIKQLQSNISPDITIIKWDEFKTSHMAKQHMRDIKMSKKKKKNTIDQIAACYILQSYLDSQPVNCRTLF